MYSLVARDNQIVMKLNTINKWCEQGICAPKSNVINDFGHMNDL